MSSETRAIRFLYGTAAGMFLNSRLSSQLVPLFIRRHHIDMCEYKDERYHSFNDFFTRKRSTNQIDITPGHMIRPGDGYLSVYPVDEKRIYHVKQMEYRLEQLLKNQSLAGQFSGGICLILRLTPQDYHRYCYVCSGTKQDFRVIPGRLHCVRPIACTSVPVFTENSREYTVISSPQFGQVVQMEIGALLVGKIHNYCREDGVWQEPYFYSCNSTVMVHIRKLRVKIEKDPKNPGYIKTVWGKGYKFDAGSK